jgi:hypothetical protein
MSRATTIIMAVTMLTLSIACSAQAPNVVAEKLYDQLDQAFANHDLNQLLAFLDPSTLVAIDVRGKRSAFGEYRKQMEQWFAQARNINANTVVKDVQLEDGRMVVYLKSETRFEFHDQRQGWVPQISTSSAEETWERKGGQWKVVLSKTLRGDTRVDPEWLAEKARLFQRSIDDARNIINNAGCSCR